jgi:hypothetical protein
MLSESDAKTLTAQAQGHALQLARLLKQLHDGQAHKALGYETWATYCIANFDASMRTIWRYIRQERMRDLLRTANLAGREFTGEALEQLAAIPDDMMLAVANIAARTTTGRIGADAVRSVQAAVAETLVTGAVEGADGQQFRVSDVMVAGVQEYQREKALEKREYFITNASMQPVELDHKHGCTLLMLQIEGVFNLPPIAKNLYISVWKKLS